MNDHHDVQDQSHTDSYLDAFAAVALILIAVITAVIWVSHA